MMDKHVQFTAYQTLYDLIPHHIKFDIFIGAYSIAEDGFDHLSHDAIKEIAEYRHFSTAAKTLLRRLAVAPDRHRYISIFRGQGSLSQPVQEAMSWTTSLKTAQWFANRFESGHVCQARVKISDIIAYITDRDDSEVMGLPSTPEDIHRCE